MGNNFMHGSYTEYAQLNYKLQMIKSKYIIKYNRSHIGYSNVYSAFIRLYGPYLYHADRFRVKLISLDHVRINGVF